MLILHNIHINNTRSTKKHGSAQKNIVRLKPGSTQKCLTQDTSVAIAKLNHPSSLKIRVNNDKSSLICRPTLSQDSAKNRIH